MTLKKTIKLAITGGPSGGKTTLIEALRKEFGQRIQIAPEAATILYKGGFPRLKTYSGRVHVQKAIYATQRELEDLLVENYPYSLIVCDRGSLDSIAYWPDSEEHFYKVMNTTKEAELARYDHVIHLDTASEDHYDTSNPIRTESYNEAMELNEKIKKSWAGHPHHHIISSQNDFYTKIKVSTELIIDLLKNQ